MDVEKELLSIIARKEGNKEMALFYHGSGWEISLGNRSDSVMLGEVPGELEASGETITEAIQKMRQRLNSVS